MVSKQLLLGIGLVVGGGALVGVLNSGDKTAKDKADDEVAHPKVELRQDIQTEKHLSEQKKKERENNTLAQEQQAKEFVEEQERAKQLASSQTNTNANANTINASVNSVVSEVSSVLPADITNPTANNTASGNNTTTSNTYDYNAVNTTETVVVQPRPEAIVAAKKAEENKLKQQARARQQKINATKPNQHTIARGDSLSELSRKYNVPVSAIMSANNMSSNDILIAGDVLVIPSKGKYTAKKSTANTVAKVNKTEKKPAKKADLTAQTKKKSSNAKSVKPFYSVQVSLADNEAKANELAKQYRQAGYKVQTSKTNRGVRVLVGSTSNAEEAKKLKAKLDKDGRVKSGDAWVKRVDTLNP